MRRRGAYSLSDEQAMHAMGIDDAYRVERVLARGAGGLTELVTLDGAGPFVRKKIPLELADRAVWARLADCSSPRLPQVVATYELPDAFVAVYGYLPGSTLEQVVEASGRMEAPDAARKAAEVAQAVADLHGHGIVHRDIAPANIILAADGAHLIDFGIARMASEAGRAPGRALGTWGFAAPEQHGFAPADERSDVYALGRVLAYLLVGVRPDDGSFEGLLADAQTVDPVLRRVVERACAFEPSARYRTADAFAEAVRAASAGPTATGGACAFPEPSGGVTGDAPAGGARDGAVPEPGARPDARRSVPGLLPVAAIAAVLGVAAAGLAFALLGPASDALRGQGGVPSSPASSEAEAPAGTGSTAGEGALPDGSSADASPASPAEAPVLRVAESGWTADAGGYIHYGISLANDGERTRIDFPEFRITGRDGEGSVVFTSTMALGSIMPGETLSYGGVAGDGSAVSTVEFEAVEPAGYQLSGAQGSAARFEATDVRAVDDGYGSLKAVGELRLADAGSGPTPWEYSMVLVSVILRDEQGTIVYGDSGFTDLPAEGGTVPFEVPLFDAPPYASIEVSAQAW